MRGLLVSFVVHASAVAGLLLLPSFSQSELPPLPRPPVAMPGWPRPVARVEIAHARPILPARGGASRGGGTAAPAATARSPFISDEPLAPGPEEPAGDPELPPGGEPGPIGLPPGPGSGADSQGPPRVVRAHRDVHPPRKLSGTLPVYPALARASHLSAVVQLECTIDNDGHVRDVRVVKGHPLFDAAAIEAVRSWRYVPTLLNGLPVAVLMTVTVNFTLAGR